MKSLKIFSTALFCARGIFGEVCLPSGMTNPAPTVSQPVKIENCATQSQPLVLQPAGTSGYGYGRTPADCIVQGSTATTTTATPTTPVAEKQPLICLPETTATSNGVRQPVNTATSYVPVQQPPVVPVQQVPIKQEVTQVPVVEKQVVRQPPVLVQKETPPPVFVKKETPKAVLVQKETPPPVVQPPEQTVTQIIQPPPQMTTTIINPPPINTTPPVTNNPPPAKPEKQELQCTIKTTSDCTPPEPQEEEVPEPLPPVSPPASELPPPHTVVHVFQPPSTPQTPVVTPPVQPQQNQLVESPICVYPTQNPPVTSTPVTNSTELCVQPVAPVAPIQTSPAPVQTSAPPVSPVQAPAKTLYVPIEQTKSSGADCTSPANLVSSLCDTTKMVPAGSMVSTQGASCEVPNNTECLEKVVKQPVQVSPQEAMECVTSPKTLVDVGVLAPATDQYIQAHQSVCV